jgi:signal peptidase I
MGSLTGLLYACLAVFLGGWYLGKWTGNFSLLLFILTLVTFAYWLAERLYFAPRRRVAAAALDRQDASGAKNWRGKASRRSTTTCRLRANRC